MSFQNNALALLVILSGLCFVPGIHLYSQEQTTAQLRQIEARRAATEAARRDKRQSQLAALNVRATAVAERNAHLKAAKNNEGEALALPGDPAKGRNNFMFCATCHGAQAEGKRAFYAPRLAGQNPWYIRSQLLKFKEGVRGVHPRDIYGMQMATAARLLYNDKVLDDVVAYIASLAADQVADISAGDATAGERHYAACANCHGHNAEGMRSQGAPKLSNQHTWYLVNQLENFANGMRTTHTNESAGQEMVSAVQRLQGGEIADLIAHIQSLAD